MTLEEKITLIMGDGMVSKSLERLGNLSLKMTDGPLGVRGAEAEYFPSSVAIATTLNLDLVFKVGQAIAKEAKAKGKNVLLAPYLNIQRVPQHEEILRALVKIPFFAAWVAITYVKGVQDENVMATPKHLVCHDQEIGRHCNDVRGDERALQEIYFPAIKAAMQEGGTWGGSWPLILGLMGIIPLRIHSFLKMFSRNF
jgi:beta-glucosidase